MSTKDMRYYRLCPVCGNKLVGTDDGLEVFESLKQMVEEIDNGKADYDTPNCTLCGEDCHLVRAREIVAHGEPELKDATDAAD